MVLLCNRRRLGVFEKFYSDSLRRYFEALNKPFHRIFVNFGLRDDPQILLVWAFLDGKTTEHYRKIFQNQRIHWKEIWHGEESNSTSFRFER